ncbi:MAG: putative DNA binding domain-containing protein [Gammaproteobacteria bacterium]|nr:putative DNA binding domain-containing protein [Gammaproteobacteria bacterium]
MTTKAELLELISHGENSGVEFKRDDVRPEQLAKEIVAFANFQGGQVLLGVDDDGSICGIQRENLEHWLVDTVFSRYIHPQIIPYYKEIRISENQHVAVITISTGVTKPYVVRQRDREDIYIRVGSTSRLATREQQARLFASGGMLYAEKLPVSGSGLSDLSQDRLKDYLLSIVGENEVPDNSKGWHTLLSKLGFMTESETGAPPVCTIAGLILFGLSPRRLLPNAGIRWMAFAGKEKSYKSLEDRLFDEPLVPIRGSPSGVGGHILENGLLESLFMAMRPFVSEELDNLDDSLRRQRSWAYPLEALRESVINAVVHRDWTRYEEIEVVRYADCLSVLSPGALQNSMTVEKMIAGQRSPRNNLIVSVLRDYGYVDSRGMGVRSKIIPLLLENNGTVPEFEATEDYLKTVMYQRM